MQEKVLQQCGGPLTTAVLSPAPLFTTLHPHTSQQPVSAAAASLPPQRVETPLNVWFLGPCIYTPFSYTINPDLPSSLSM